MGAFLTTFLFLQIILLFLYKSFIVGNVLHDINSLMFEIKLFFPNRIQFELDEYYYEVAEFIDLVLSGKRQSGINSHEHSLITLEIIDEVRRQLGIRYPADRY